MHRGAIRAGVVMGVLAFTVAGCSSGTAAGGEGDGRGSDGPASASPTDAGPSDGASIAIVDFSFEPDVLSVAPGTLTITVSNEDSVSHTFTLDDGRLDQAVSRQSSVDVELEVTETVTYHCEIHRSMTGTIEVSG